MIIDTHLHVVDQKRLRYPWLDGEPALNRDHPYEVYEAAAKRVGITAALHMEVDVDGEDIEAETAYVAELAARPGSLVVGAISACRPESPHFAGFLERQQDNPLVKGFRRVLHVMPDDLSEGALFRENIRRLAGSGLPFDLVVFPRQLDRAIALADLAPDVQFVLDHCGVPDIRGEEWAPWRDGVAEIAKRPNVAAKISGVMAYAPEGWVLDTLRPWVGHVIDSFGFGRVVWGSDWPVCTLGGDVPTWVAATHALTEGASLDEKAALFSGNARRIWRL